MFGVEFSVQFVVKFEVKIDFEVTFYVEFISSSRQRFFEILRLVTQLRATSFPNLYKIVQLK